MDGKLSKLRSSVFETPLCPRNVRLPSTGTNVVESSVDPVTSTVGKPLAPLSGYVVPVQTALVEPPDVRDRE
jgi:hypothetical protein